LNLSNTAFDPKSGEHDAQIPPILATAKKEITASGIFGKIPATRSPFKMFIFLK